MPHKLAVPWARRGNLYSTPGSVILKLALGEAPEHIPAVTDVRAGAQRAAGRVDGGHVDRVLNHFSDRVQVTRVHSAAAALGQVGRRHRHFDSLEQATGLARTLRVDVDRDACITDVVDALRQLASVEEASPRYLCSLPFAAAATAPAAWPTLDEAWSARTQVHGAEAMAYEPGDRAVIVAIVDTGVVVEHPELQRHLRRGLDAVELRDDEVAGGIRLLGDHTEVDRDPDDLVGHGTSCAAIIGAAGEHIPPGLAGDCGLLPIRVLSAALFPGRSEPVGIGAISDIDRGCKNAIDLGAKVLNMSFGTPQEALAANDPLPHTDLVRYGLGRGCIMVAACGNSGKAEAFTPACLDGVIAVAACGRNGLPTTFSTTGPHVALAAPGERVLSAGLHGYALVTGTSFAAPFVAAAAALLVSRAAGRAYALDSGDARRILCESARPWPAGVEAGYGAGTLDALAALQMLDRQIDLAEQAFAHPA